MATSLKNLSEYDINSVPGAEGMKVGIVVSEWNIDITGALRDGAINTLLKHGAKEEDIMLSYVPGTFELTFGAAKLMNETELDAIITIGCVIKGDTPHFDYVCSGVTQGITSLNAEGDVPVIFGVLTTDNLQQALDRAGGKHGNKGDEAAITAIKMIDFACEIKK